MFTFSLYVSFLMFYGFYCTGKLFGERSVSILRTRPVRLVFVSSISAFLVGIFLRQENHIQKQIIITHHGHELVTLPELSLALHKLSTYYGGKHHSSSLLTSDIFIFLSFFKFRCAFKLKCNFWLTFHPNLSTSSLVISSSVP